jgi:hypothetical protein
MLLMGRERRLARMSAKKTDTKMLTRKYKKVAMKAIRLKSIALKKKQMPKNPYRIIIRIKDRKILL